MKIWKQRAIAALLVLVCLVSTGCTEIGLSPPQEAMTSVSSVEYVPDFSGEPYVFIGNSKPDFENTTTNSYETYAPLDEMGRCGTAEACVGVDLMPTEERGSIGSVKPSGWQSAKYDCVDGKYLYNRCHLIGYQLSGENANKQNLITGTRYLNVEGMLPFENLVADYVKETENHVLYRVCPVYDGKNLVASGVTMEAKSVEDDGEGVSFFVYVYNVQPGVEIDYATGESWLEGGTRPEAAPETAYVLNTSSKKFHLPDCSGAASISEGNREEFTGGRSELVKKGYEPCGKCKP